MRTSVNFWYFVAASLIGGAANGSFAWYIAAAGKNSTSSQLALVTLLLWIWGLCALLVAMKAEAYSRNAVNAEPGEQEYLRRAFVRARLWVLGLSCVVSIAWIFLFGRRI